MINPNPGIPPQFTLQQLLTHFELLERMTGEKPKQVIVSEECLAWFKEQVKQVIKNFNIPTTKNFKRDEFMGVELVTKS